VASQGCDALNRLFVTAYLAATSIARVPRSNDRARAGFRIPRNREARKRNIFGPALCRRYVGPETGLVQKEQSRDLRPPAEIVDRSARWCNLTPVHICRSIFMLHLLKVAEYLAPRPGRHWRPIMWSRRRAADADTMSAGPHLVRSMTPPGT